MGEYLHNFKGIMKAAGLYHEIRWNVHFFMGIAFNMIIGKSGKQEADRLL